MKSKIKNSIITFLSVVIVSTSFSYAQNMSSDSMKMDHGQMKNMNMQSDSIHSMDHKHMKGMHMMNDSSAVKSDTSKDSIVREGVIDLKAIDKNNDGKVYQDLMDWNVISDKPGRCPLCGMKLKEVTLDQAKEYLEKNGYKVKE